MTLQRIGGYAAFFEALAYIVGFAFMLLVLQPATSAAGTPAEKLGAILGMSGAVLAWNIVIYVLFGVVLVVLVLALHERLSAGAASLMKAASAFGLIWSGLVIATGMIANVGLGMLAKLYASDPQGATLAWQILNAVQEGLGGGVEVVGGLWVMLVSVAALSQSLLPKLLNYLGMAIGAAGVLTIFPPLDELGAVFGLGQIAWFIWLGIVLLSAPVAAPSTSAQPG